MRIIGIMGQLGQGKTLLLAILTHLYKKRGYYIYTNIQSLKDKDSYIRALSIDFYKDVDSKKLLAIDEAYLLFDSRNTMSQNNKLNSYIIMQSRKNNFDIIYTTNYFYNVDKRIRLLTTDFFYVSYTDLRLDKTKTDYPKDEIVGILHIEKLDERGNTLAKRDIMIKEGIFDLFNSKEKIEIKK